MFKTYRSLSLLCAAFIITAACGPASEPLTTFNKADRDHFCEDRGKDPICLPPKLTPQDSIFALSKGVYQILATRPVVQAWGETMSASLEQNGRIIDLDIVGGEIENLFQIAPSDGQLCTLSGTFKAGTAKLNIYFHASDDTIYLTEKNISLDLTASSGNFFCP